MLRAFVRLLIDRCLIFDADPICVGTGQFIAPFYLREGHAAQTVSVIIQRVGALVFFHANANGCSGLQKQIDSLLSDQVKYQSFINN